MSCKIAFIYRSMHLIRNSIEEDIYKENLEEDKKYQGSETDYEKLEELEVE